MKVFISWSGERSKALASSLREWLPMVLQYVEPWVSDKDISAGDRWAQEIAGELESSNFGIICVTPENVNSEWILFESGALSKSMLDGKVIPLLFDLELSDLSGPLSQFQAKKVEQGGLLEVVRAINKVSDTKASEEIVEKAVPALWPNFEESLEKMPDVKVAGKHNRPQQEILEELVTGVRGLNARMRDFDEGFSDRKISRRYKKRRFHPRMLEELNYMPDEMDNAPVSLLLLAGYMRDVFPWLAELFSESYREIRDSNHKDVERIIHRLRRTVKHLMHGPMMEVFGHGKGNMMMAEDLMMALDMTLHQVERTSSSKLKNEDEMDK